MLTFLMFAYCGVFDCIPHNPPVNPEVTQARQDVLLGGNGHFSPIATTLNGKVAGYVMRTLRNRPIAAYEGIPYAMPPIRHRRFRSPVPAAPWKGIREAKKPGPACLQFDYSAFYLTHGQEDCLYLNSLGIYDLKLTPSKGKPTSLLPVFVFIHGGGHFFGTGANYGPAYLLDTQDIILVTFNYRLGILGFLSTGDEDASGNWGMKDQALLLRWVQKNIAGFGGDLNRITLAGHSSGSVSAGLHLVSPLTRDIPQQAILQSGSPFGFWGVLNRTADSSRLVAQKVNCPISNSKQMLNCLRSMNANELVRNQWAAWKTLDFPIINFGPVVESSNVEDAFLTESVENAFRLGHVSRAPVLLGHVQDEGDLMTAYIYLRQEFKQLSQNSTRIFPYLFEYQDLHLLEQEEIKRQIGEFYLNNEPVTFQTKWRLSKAIGDRYFNTPIRKEMEIRSRYAPTYAYFFNYSGEHSSLESLGLNRGDWKISHVDDMAYLFNNTLSFKPVNPSDVDYFMVEFITNVWASFASTGKPVYRNANGEDVGVWSPLNPNSEPGEIPNVMEINRKIKMMKYPFEEEFNFWKNFKLI